MLTPYLWIAGGGAIGACARYAMSQMTLKAFGAQFPWGTFLVNVLGCLLFGLIAGMAASKDLFGTAGRVFLLVGVLGGFTTFSSFAFETVELVRTGQSASAFANVGGQVVLGTLAVYAGLALTSPYP